MSEAWVTLDPTVWGGTTSQNNTDTPPQLAKNRLMAARGNEYERVFDMLQDRAEDYGLGGATLPSAGTVELGSAAIDYDYILISGNTNITSFGSANPGTTRKVRFTAAGGFLTYHATNLYLPGQANITWAAGDVFIFACDGDGANPPAAGSRWRCIGINLATGRPLIEDWVITASVLQPKTPANVDRVKVVGAVIDGSADDGVLEVDTSNALATAGDMLIHAKMNTASKYAVDYAGLEYRRSVRVVSSIPRAELIASSDFDQTDLIVDGAVHDEDSGGPGDERLDLSGIITDVDAKMVGLLLIFRSATAGQFGIFTGEENFSANDSWNKADIRVESVNKYVAGYYEITLPSDGTRSLSYVVGANVNYLHGAVIKWEV